MHIDDLLGRFEAVRWDKDGYLVRCPEHDDGDPSLKIMIGDDRKVRLTCRAGCKTADVRLAAGLSWKDLFDVDGDVTTVPAAPPIPADDEAIAALSNFVAGTSHGLIEGSADWARLAEHYILDRFGVSARDFEALGVGVSDPDDPDPRFPYLSAAFQRYPRLTVPLRDFDGVSRGLQGRDLTGDCPARWVSLSNPPGQRWQAYGVLRAGADEGRDEVLITEGPSDALTVAALGFDVVFIRGAALASSPALMEEIAHGLRGRTVVSAGDSDAAGRGFNRRLGDGLAAFGITVHALEIPGGAGDVSDWRSLDPEGFPGAFSEAVRGASAVPAEVGARPAAGGDGGTDSAVKPDLPAVIEAAPRGADYWRGVAEGLDPKPDVRHVNYAQFVADHCGSRLRHVPELGWFRWDGRVWREAGDTGAAMQAITDASRILLEERGTDGWAREAAGKMLVNSIRTGIVNEMAVLPDFAATVDDMDAQLHLLSFANGTVDLRTGILHPHSPADMLTQIAPVAYVPNATCPRWLRFVEEVFPGDPELQDYYQTWLGMCATGEVRDHALGVWYGQQGRNGKGTTVRTMTAILGTDFVHEVPFELFEARSGNQVHTETIAALRNARMVVAQEGNQGVPMDVARLKHWTGGDRIEARHLYGRPFKFEPKFTLTLATNFLPEFSAGGAPLWARTKAIHFGQSFADRVDPDLEPTIQGPEAEGVAAWVVRGAMRYYAQRRLIDPLSVLAAKEHHKDEVDPLKPLVGELFDYAPGASVKRSSFNAELKQWREDNGERGGKFAPGIVKRHLMTNGVTETRLSGTGWMYEGIYLLSDVPPDTSEESGIFNREEG